MISCKNMYIFKFCLLQIQCTCTWCCWFKQYTFQTVYNVRRLHFKSLEYDCTSVCTCTCCFDFSMAIVIFKYLSCDVCVGSIQDGHHTFRTFINKSLVCCFQTNLFYQKYFIAGRDLK